MSNSWRERPCPGRSECENRCAGKGGCKSDGWRECGCRGMSNGWRNSVCPGRSECERRHNRETWG